MTQVMHEPDKNRFLALVDGVECVLDYRLAGAVMTITHTGVPETVGGRGIAADLMHFALESARTLGWKVVPDCSYAAVYFKRHPAFADLLQG
jgi:uncharacterized protein